MPRTLPAALTTVMDAGAYEPYLRVQISDTPIDDLSATTVQPLGFRLEALSAQAKFARYTNDVDTMVYFRIIRGALINGAPSTISSIWFRVIELTYDGKFVTVNGEALEQGYLTIAANSIYSDVIEAALARAFDTIMPSYEGGHDWTEYQFYPTGKAIVLSPIKKLFTVLKQKYLVFATEDGWDGVNNNMFFFVATQTRATDYTFIDLLFQGNEHIEQRKLISRDEAATIHTTGDSTNPLHNLGFLHSTAVHPDSAPVLNKYIGARSSKLPVHLKYRTGDKAECLGDLSSLNQLNSRINVIEVLDLQSTPAWYQIIEGLIWYGNTEGGPMPSTIEAAAPYTPLATGNFAGILSANDNNIQAAMETIDDHSHGSSAPATTALDDFQMGNGSGAWITKTLAQAVTRIRTILDSIYSLAAHNHTGVYATRAVILYATNALSAVIPASTTHFAIAYNDTIGATDRGMPALRAGTVKNLYFRTATNQPASGNLVVTVRKNSTTDTAITLTVLAGAGAGTTHSDTTHSFTVVAGDTLGVKMQNLATGNSAQIGFIAFELEYDS